MSNNAINNRHRRAMSLRIMTMEQYRKSPRAKFLDYDGGAYFITICTRKRSHYFGEIYDREMHLNKIGKFAELQLTSASDFCKDIYVPLFTIMPNHIHAIVVVNRRDMPPACINANLLQRAPNPILRANPTNQRHIPALSRYISSFKGAVTKYAKSQGLDFGWQSRYHDHFIRGIHDGNKISEYIINNVAAWHEDCFFEDEI